MARKEIALTFDDGPSKDTPKILEILKQYGVSAAFCVCGRNIERNPHIITQAAKEGHLFCNHSFHHMGPLTTPRGIKRTQRLIEYHTGQDEKLFRMPNIFPPPILYQWLQNNGYSILPFGVMGFDWQKGQTGETIAANIIEGIENNDIPFSTSNLEKQLHLYLRKKYPWWFGQDIILLHDGDGINPLGDRTPTVEALPIIIEALHDRGCTFVRLDKMIEGKK